MPVVDVDRLKEQGRRFVDGFTPGQKAMTILGVVAVVLAGMTFMKWASKPDMAPLYTGLSSQDAGAVTTALDAQHVKYTISGGGGTIMVPRKDVDKTRIGLSSKNIPAGGDSFVLLDKQGITTDQFTRNIAYQRALQGELAKAIESIDSVATATVTLTIPQQTVFVGASEDKPTAAVLVKTTGGSMSADAVNAIVHLVASSIPNMNPDDVTVADANGSVLHAPGMDTQVGSNSQLAQQQTYNATLEKSIEDMVSKTLGPGHAAVTVAADLDTSKSTSTSNTYGEVVKGKTIPITQSGTAETLNQAGGAAPNGNLGIPNGTPTGTGTTTPTTGYSKTSSQSTNAVNNTTVNSVIPPGTVKHLSVSVLLDSSVVKAADIATIWQPQILAAAGIQPRRDGANALKVTTVAFDKTAQKAQQSQLAAATGSNPLFDLIKHILTLLMIAVVLFFAWKAIKRAENNRVPLRVPLDLLELEAPAHAQLEPAYAAARVAAAPARSIEPPASTIEGEITDLIERQPDEVAQTLRSWLADRRT
ncbi:MAG TPA: flagellar basal-body MS-ring/collar protein FliF [Acidimicrobiia bacterium]|jgi:flagellar M-ring protein FliF|nr:flagellar basal-body MS-ring/collar protein FliF [Acidimicrobiia bacterium]